MKLTQHEIDLFRHLGYIKLPTQLDQGRVKALKSAALKDLEEGLEPITRREDGTPHRLSNVWGRGSVFREMIQCDEILDPLESLLGPNIDFLLNRHNHFYLRERESTASIELHRDVRQWSRTIVTILIYLEDTNLENGCTCLVPGSHLLPAFRDASNDETLRISLSQTVPVPMPSGGLLAMDGMTLHAAGQNQTENTRMGITLSYHSVDEFSLPDDEKRVLVRGERAYKGNDRSFSLRKTTRPNAT